MKIKIFPQLKLLIILIIPLAFSYFSTNIARYGWKTFIGNEIFWRNIKINLADDFFVFPNANSILTPISDDQPIIICKFDSSKKAFPNNNYILVDDRKFDSGRISDIFRLFCKEKSCKEFEEHESILNNANVICIQFSGIIKPFFKGNFHVYCNVRTSKTVVEYDGSFDDFSNFKTIQDQILTAIAESSNRQQ
jgi:hypothetical protein